MTEIINSLKSPPTIEVKFVWTPASTFSYAGSSGGKAVTVIVPSARANTNLTFTATAQINNDPAGRLSIVEYRWDFGDGVQAYGSPIVHRYTFANLQAFTVLRVADNKGGLWYARQQMYVT